MIAEMEATVSAGEAARLLGVSIDTIRNWDRDGKIETSRTLGNQRRVPLREITRIQSERGE